MMPPRGIDITINSAHAHFGMYGTSCVTKWMSKPAEKMAANAKIGIHAAKFKTSPSNG
jgi:hypothetical protein